MLNRLIVRVVWSLLTLLGTATLTFVLVHALPGDVARVIAGPKATPETLREIHARLGLDDPWPTQLGRYLVRVARGDLGHSYVTDQPVLDAILVRLPATATLAFTAALLWTALALPVGIATARRPGTTFDRIILVVASLTLSLPAFWLARLLQYFLSYKLGWFPVAGWQSFRHVLLPAGTLAILSFGYYARLLHSNLVEVLHSPYIRAARAKGLPEWRVILQHALRNALIPVVTVLGMDLAGLLGGVIFTENVFALPGIGTLAAQSVFTFDTPVIMGTVLFSGALIVAANFLVDLLTLWIDPRIRAL